MVWGNYQLTEKIFNLNVFIADIVYNMKVMSDNKTRKEALP